MNNTIMEIIKKAVDNDSVVLEYDTNLIDQGLVDSILMMEIITDIEETFNIEIDGDDIDPENFLSVGTITQLVNKYLKP